MPTTTTLSLLEATPCSALTLIALAIRFRHIPDAAREGGVQHTMYMRMPSRVAEVGRHGLASHVSASGGGDGDDVCLYTHQQGVKSWLLLVCMYLFQAPGSSVYGVLTYYAQLLLDFHHPGCADGSLFFALIYAESHTPFSSTDLHKLQLHLDYSLTSFDASK